LLDLIFRTYEWMALNRLVNESLDNLHFSEHTM
jgi:hypothetical protein